MTSGHPKGDPTSTRPVEPHAAASGATSFAPKWPRAEATAPATRRPGRISMVFQDVAY